uniref:head GIN domain-containing protein n=1 Tax=Flavobacterium sp. TaxID=239 RepID=UPI0040492E2A
MKKIAFTLALFCMTFTQAQNWKKEKIKESGIQKTITRTTPTYDEISAGGSFYVELVSGKEGNITINGDENIISHIVTEVENNKLIVRFEKNKNYSYRSKIVITIPFEEISVVSFAGSGEIKTKNTINASKLDILFTGSGEGNFDVNAEQLKTSLSGSGDVVFSGKTTELEGKIAGSGTLDFSKVTATNANVVIAGSGNIKVNCTNTLIAKVAGSGSIQYKAKPQSLDKTVAGSGEIIAY